MSIVRTNASHFFGLTTKCESLLSAALLERNEMWGLKDSNLGFCNSLCAAGVRDPKDVL